MQDQGREQDGGRRPATTGELIREMRLARGLRLADLAQRLNRSVGWLSQVERRLSVPSLADLREIARALDTPLAELLRPESIGPDAGRIVRAEARAPVATRTEGIVTELLTPGEPDRFEILMITVGAGRAMTRAGRIAGQLVVLVLEGALDITIGAERFPVAAGDTIRIDDEPFLWMNCQDAPCRLIAIVSPPEAVRHWSDGDTNRAAGDGPGADGLNTDGLGTDGLGTGAQVWQGDGGAAPPQAGR
ncbi:MAG: helix-turn-helix transcriptional regulator [Rubellimicrobium sp.]|nr:helix-turn-helix transcriptional regulator [Rubellimicrobium sp.]